MTLLCGLDQYLVVVECNYKFCYSQLPSHKFSARLLFDYSDNVMSPEWNSSHGKCVLMVFVTSLMATVESKVVGIDIQTMLCHQNGTVPMESVCYWSLSLL